MLKVNNAIAQKILEAIVAEETKRLKKAVQGKNSRKAFRLKKDLAPIEKLLKLFLK